jgi:hypothetical protein
VDFNIFQQFSGHIDHRSSSFSKGALDPHGPGASAALSSTVPDGETLSKKFGGLDVEMVLNLKVSVNNFLCPEFFISQENSWQF